MQLPGRTLVYLVTEDWYFLSHRLPMARAARDAGCEVHVIARVQQGGALIEREGFLLHPVEWQRGSLNPFRVLSLLFRIRKIYRQVDPDIIHHVGLLPTLIGATAALGLGMAKVNALTGFGFFFSSDSAKARLMRPFLRRLLAFLLRQPKATALVQNRDDAAFITSLSVAPAQIEMIRGSGVELQRFHPLPEPAQPFTVAFVGRLLQDKGVGTLVAAHELLLLRSLDIKLLLAGMPDPANPASLEAKTLARWRQHRSIELLGHVDDVNSVWARAHVGILPSRREGLPKSLLEAAACQRALIATDVPGCRELVCDGVNGLLVPVDDPAALAAAIERLFRSPKLRSRFAAAARRMVVEDFDSGHIGQEIVRLYHDIIEGAESRPQSEARPC
jgi:glycosyltransferase involved in cell wall biosynthesis